MTVDGGAPPGPDSEAPTAPGRGHASGETGAGEATGDLDDAAALERLRGLLLGDADERLRKVEASLAEQRLSPQDVSRVLPAAFRLRPTNDPQLDNALAPTLEGAVNDSVRNNPQAMADAIFPILGPAIRKAIRAALAGMVESFNTALEHALSPRGIRWRLEAARTGRSFGEVVLMHSLLYRTEQVLLVHRETSTLLCHAHASSVAAGDPDLISAMLSAIQDFVGDSFADGERQVLKIARFEDFSLHVVVGPQLVLAALVRGEAPAEYHEHLERTLEQAHLDSSRTLDAFDGDTEPFEALTGLLESCLQEVQRERAPNKLLIGGWVLGVLAVLAWVGLSVAQRNATVDRWRGAVADVAATPGLVVLSREFGDDVLELSCLADPAARAPDAVLAAAGLAADEYALAVTPWRCLEPAFVLPRLERALAAPPGVRVDLDDAGVLHLEGRAPRAWITRALTVAPTVDGVTDVRAELSDDDLRVLNSGRERLESAVVYFAPGQVEPQLDDLRADIAEAVERLITGSRALGIPVRLEVLGWSADDERDDDLARRRAERTVTALGDVLPADLWVEAGPGRGARLPTLGESHVAGETLRRVRFQVVLLAPLPHELQP